MRDYKVYVDPTTGKCFEATSDQIQSEPDQILVIEGIQAVTPPPIWIGDYHGEMLFYPWKLVDLKGSEWLNIKVNAIVIRTIVNTGFDKHIVTIQKVDIFYKKDIENLFSGIESLTNM
jgi:hypothetical protein